MTNAPHSHVSIAAKDVQSLLETTGSDGTEVLLSQRGRCLIIQFVVYDIPTLINLPLANGILHAWVFPGTSGIGCITIFKLTELPPQPKLDTTRQNQGKTNRNEGLSKRYHRYSLLL